MRNEIIKYIVGYIEKKGKLPDNIDVETFDYVITGYLDSLAVFKFVVDIESKYDIEFSEDDLMIPEIKTIGGMADIIENLVKVTK
ncbi:MAG: acyl carrier protein [Peptococcaceae bacterium]|nr:acyl carrier protein [Peptococcaceae bacterium]